MVIVRPSDYTSVDAEASLGASLREPAAVVKQQCTDSSEATVN